ncbi:hypothetical protein MTBLM5_210001 [Magnetospirillum sp. LM-5]|nr:hypothetical protein MTBLM5_210001 [Magnetospirillum sp. LM-5]
MCDGVLYANPEHASAADSRSVFKSHFRNDSRQRNKPNERAKRVSLPKASQLQLEPLRTTEAINVLEEQKEKSKWD